MTAWVVRGGSMGEHEQYALDHGVATVNWPVPDLNGCTSREAVQEQVRPLYPDYSPNKLGAQTGQLWAFRDKIKPGDIVVMPLKSKPGYLAFGRCTGGYVFDADNPDAARRHQLPVQWSPEVVSKVALKDDLLYSLNAIRTVFSPSRHNAEARLAAAMATGIDPGNNTSIPPGPTPPTTGDDSADVVDPSPAPTLDAIQDRIRTHLVENFAGHKLTRLVADILEALGYACIVSPPGPDGGVDILAGRGPLGLDSPTLIVEVKSEPTPVGALVVRGLHSAMTRYQADQALLVAWGGVTAPAGREFAPVGTRLRIWDASELLDQLFATYDRLPTATRAAIPLRMAWVLDDEQDD